MDVNRYIILLFGNAYYILEDVLEILRFAQDDKTDRKDDKRRGAQYESKTTTE